MARIYTKIDKNNVAVIETVENRQILNKETLITQKEIIAKKYKEDIKLIDEALMQFK